MKRLVKRERTFSGLRTNIPTEKELAHRQVARKAAGEGIVLLKNEGILPFYKEEKIAVFGGGATHTIKGGTGSGDVCEREVVSIYEGLKNADACIVNEDWNVRYDAMFNEAREAWRQEILAESGGIRSNTFFDVLAAHTFRMPCGCPMSEKDFEGAEACIYVISRTAGEGNDRRDEAGDYYLTEEEKAEIQYVADHHDNLVIIFNVGGQIDVKFILGLPQVKAILQVSQPGMEGGNAVADVLYGKVNPSGRLTNTWTYNYEDFPNANTFSFKNGDITKEYYEDGIYVGYRYFDSFGKEVAFPFGYGLSYTSFERKVTDISVLGNEVKVQVSVTNTGDTFAGKEVVEVFASCPQEKLAKEVKRLVAFAKTGLLAPGQEETLTISIDAKMLASFDEETHAWILEAGEYLLLLACPEEVAGLLKVEEEVILEKTPAICPLKEELTEMVRPADLMEAMVTSWKKEAEEKGLKAVSFAPTMEEKKFRLPDEWDYLAEELSEKLTDEELVAMVIGEISRGHDVAYGSAGIMVPGAAGETSGILETKYDFPAVSMADGPAGVRVIQKYQGNEAENVVYTQGIGAAIEGAIFAEEEDYEGCTTFYQFCTAFPVGTMLAQTWNVNMMEEVGRTAGEELADLGIAWWLAPGMNIHRNPLCGRNFEYYGEDPVLSGIMAAAITKGVQTIPGVGTTIKHFACNNLEDNRMGNNSILSERALREIYLRGFEIAVRTAQPMSVMTSYNLINGVHSANNYDLCTVVLREEWDFQGMVMTDWTTTSQRGGSTAYKCAQAGNDLIMPGEPNDVVDITEALKDGRLDHADLKRCVKRLIRVILHTNGFENPESYREYLGV